jgi:nicotinamidase/pyrazinamidase
MGKKPKEYVMTGVIVVDIQGDFTELMNGPLAVPRTNLDYLHQVNRETEKLKDNGYPLWATQDWHPEDHISFSTSHPGKQAFEKIPLQGKEQVLWPPHCIQGSQGAELLLETSLFEAIIKKGRDPSHDSYSGFQDDGGQDTGLEGLLREKGIRKVIIYGIATDYCVRATALDARRHSFETVVVTGLCRGVSQETTEQALREMQLSGVTLLENLNTL